MNTPTTLARIHTLPVIAILHSPVFRLFSILFAALLVCVLAGASLAQQGQGAEATISGKGEIEAVVKTLEDPAKRAELVKALKVMAKAQEEDQADSQLKSVAAQMLNDIARQVDSVSDSVVSIAGTINEVPVVASWVKTEIEDPKARKMWTDVGINLVLTLGLGYLAFYLMRLALVRSKRAVAQHQQSTLWARLLRLVLLLILDILPIVAFGVVAYLTLGMVSPRQKTRLVALAWVNAFLISHTIIAVFSMAYAPQAPALRPIRISEESASYLDIWTKRLTYTTIYGYFALQAALLLGLPSQAYDSLLRLLGLFVTMLVIILIMQNRSTVAEYLTTLLQEKRSDGDQEDPAKSRMAATRQRAKGLLHRLAAVWHLLASFYVLLLFGVWALRIPGGFFFLFKATALSVVSLLVLRLALGLLNTVFKRGFQIGDELKTRLPGLEKRANQYISTVHTALRIGCYFFALLLIMQAWGLDTIGWITSESGRIIGGTIASVAGILIVTFVIWESVNSLIENNLTPKTTGTGSEVSARTRTLLTVARKALAIVLIVVSSLMVLDQLGINIAPLLAGAGVLGLAIGFGSQKLVQDVITGIFILLEDQMAVGDVVDLGGLAGEVEAVSIRTVRLRDVAGVVHTIPFSAISTVSNKTKDFSYYVMDVGIGYRENVDEVMQILKDLGTELQQDPLHGPRILEPLEVMGVNAFMDSAVVIRARLKTVPNKQWNVGREFNRRMKLKFDELDIEIPFPHQTIYFGVDKKGDAPSARVAIHQESTQPVAAAK